MKKITLCYSFILLIIIVAFFSASCTHNTDDSTTQSQTQIKIYKGNDNLCKLENKVKYVFETDILNQQYSPVRVISWDDFKAEVNLISFVNSGKANIKSITTYRVNNEYENCGQMAYAEVWYYSDDGIGQKVKMCDVVNNETINHTILGDVPILTMPVDDKMTGTIEIPGKDILGNQKVDKLIIKDYPEAPIEYSYQQVFYINK